jgi:hypothetical protein
MVSLVHWLVQDQVSVAKYKLQIKKFPVQKSTVSRWTGQIVEAYTKQHGNQILDLGYYDHTLQHM